MRLTSAPWTIYDGATVTAREQRTGLRHTFMLPGEPISALELLATAIDRCRAKAATTSRPGDWRLLCYSTPETIHNDLAGVRRYASPERAALAAIGRLDLLDPEVRR